MLSIPSGRLDRLQTVAAERGDLPGVLTRRFVSIKTTLIFDPEERWNYGVIVFCRRQTNFYHWIYQTRILIGAFCAQAIPFTDSLLLSQKPDLKNH